MMTRVRVHIGSGHAGFELKSHLLAHLASLGHYVVDVGPALYDADEDDAPFCIATGLAVLADPGSLGIVVGWSGNGEQIAANKVPGIRAALAWSVETATLGRQHNDAQVVAIGARMHTLDEAAEIVTAFVVSAFSSAPRHRRRIEMIDRYESTHIPPALPKS